MRPKFDPTLTRFMNMPGEMRDAALAAQRLPYVESEEVKTNHKIR
jgi:hypothetical protein